MASTKDLLSEFLKKSLFECQAFGIWMHVNRGLKEDIGHMANILTLDIKARRLAQDQSRNVSQSQLRIAAVKL